jgi:hypothetical protein
MRNAQRNTDATQLQLCRRPAIILDCSQYVRQALGGVIESTIRWEGSHLENAVDLGRGYQEESGMPAGIPSDSNQFEWTITHDALASGAGRRESYARYVIRIK